MSPKLSKAENPNSHLSRFTKPSVIYPVIILFLEFFAWGLLTTPTLNQLNKTFGADTLLINGIIQGIKGFLSFLSAPLIGAFSDIKGRRPLLLITVIATCIPIPLLIIQPYWFFTLLSLSGIFSVTYTIVFAYVSDITDESERNTAFGLVSATFAASLVISPAIGTLIQARHGPSLVVFISTMAALLDVLFIIFFVPESLGYKQRNLSKNLDIAFGSGDEELDNMQNFSDSGGGTICNNRNNENKKLLSPDSMEKINQHRRKISWDQIDPFKAIKHISSDKALWMISLAVCLSYMPEAGQYNSFMLYLMTMVGFSAEEVSLFIAWVGTLAVFAQVFLLTWLTNKFPQRTAILIGLFCQAIQLCIYAFTTNYFLIWLMAILLAVSSIVYPAMNGWCSLICDQDNQGVIQGVITGIRGLCMGIGPAIYGLIFHLFGVDLEGMDNMIPNNSNQNDITNNNNKFNNLKNGITLNDLTDENFNIKDLNEFIEKRSSFYGNKFMPGPPFLFAAISVFLSILVVLLIENPLPSNNNSSKILNSNTGNKAKYERLSNMEEFENNNLVGVTSLNISEDSNTNSNSSGLTKRKGEIQ